MRLKDINKLMATPTFHVVHVVGGREMFIFNKNKEIVLVIPETHNFVEIVLRVSAT